MGLCVNRMCPVWLNDKMIEGKDPMIDWLTDFLVLTFKSNFSLIRRCHNSRQRAALHNTAWLIKIGASSQHIIENGALERHTWGTKLKVKTFRSRVICIFPSISAVWFVTITTFLQPYLCVCLCLVYALSFCSCSLNFKFPMLLLYHCSLH